MSFLCRFQILYRTVMPQFFDSGAPRADPDKAEQRLRMCRVGRGLRSKLVSFTKGFQNIPTFWRFLRWILNI